MDKIKFNRNTLYILLLAVSMPAFFFSCKKVDVKENVIERFLKLPDGASPQLLRIAADLREKEMKTPFIEQFVANVGYPLWEYAKTRKIKAKNNFLAREDGVPEEIIELPLVLNETKFVNAILNIKLQVDEILYKLYEGINWESYGFDKDPNRTLPNANDIVGKLMDYEKLIWGKDIFKITDKRLFDYWPTGDTKPESFYIRRKTTIDGIKIITVVSDCLKPNGDGQVHGVWPGHEAPTGYHWGICSSSWVINEDDPSNPFGGSANNPSSTILAWSGAGGAGSGGGSGGGDGACTPFPWVGLAVRGSGTYQPVFNPCFEEVPPPVDIEFGTPPVQVDDVDRSHLTDPCHIAAFDKIGVDKLKAELVKMYTETYVGTNKVHNLTLWSSSYAPSSDGQGVVLAGSDIDPAQPDTWNIYLSINNLGNTLSEEAWVGMILHELVHSFIQKNNIGFNPFDRNNTHHTTMLNDWVAQIKDALKEICGMPDADALALALRGFDNIFKDEPTGQFLPEMITKVQEMFGVNLNDAKTLADKYYNGQKGTVCQ